MPITGLMMQAVRNGGAVAAVVAAGGSAIDPETLTPYFAYDFTRRTLYTDHAGLTPTTTAAAQILRVNDGVGSLGVQLWDDASHGGPLLQKDAANSNRQFLQYAAASQRRLVTTNITLPLPYSRVSILRIDTPAVGKTFMSGRGAAFVNTLECKDAGPNLDQYNGTANGNTSPFTAATWFVCIEDFVNPTSTCQVNNGSVQSANIGTLAFAGTDAFTIGGGPDASLSFLDFSIMACWGVPLLSTPNRNGVRTFAGNYVGLSL